MFFLSVFALAAGFLLNEESIIARICQRRAIANLGWFVLHEESSLWIFLCAGLCSFVKGMLGAAVIADKLTPESGFICGALFVAGNILAAKHCQGLAFTPALSALGLTLMTALPVFHAASTAFVVTTLVTRRLSCGSKAGHAAFCLACLIYEGRVSFLIWTLTALVAAIICGAESPFFPHVIRYSARILRWRVTI